MSDRLAELGDDTEVALITFTDAQSLDSYQETHQLPFTVLTDPDRTGYRAYGLGRGSFLRIWGWKAARRYLELFRQSGFSGLHRPTEDSLQLGGDFVISADGNLTWTFWGDGPDDRPSVDELIAAVTRVSA